MKKIVYIIIALVSVTAIYRVVVFTIEKMNPAKEEEVRKVPVKAIEVIKTSLVNSLDLTGEIVGREMVNVFSQVPGKIEEILAREGQYVNKGQVIIKVNRDIVGMDYMPAIVESPISGYMGRVMADRGMTISPATPLAQVVNMRQVEALVQIMEEQINSVQVGMSALIKVGAFPDALFTGKVYKKNAVLDSASRTQEVHIILENPGLKLKHGMFADVKIITSKSGNVLAVPVDSVSEDAHGNYYVYTVINNTAERTIIETGLSDSKYIEVRSGLKAGDIIVTLGKENISDGDGLVVYRDDLDKSAGSAENKK